MKWNKIMVLMTCCMLLLSGCATKNTANAQKHEAMTFAMDTLMMLTVYDKNGEQILVDAEQEIRRLENLLSVTIEDSDIAKLNHNAGKEAVAISDDTMSLLQVGNDINVLTNGCYSMIGPYRPLSKHGALQKKHTKSHHNKRLIYYCHWSIIML